MSTVSGMYEAPRHVGRYLLDGESLVIAVRRHPAVIVEPVLSAVVALFVALWVDERLPPNGSAAADILWVAWIVVVGRAVWELLQWRNDWFVATDRRLMLTYGLITRKVAMMPLIKVTDMSYNRTPVGRVLGYGEFILESAGQDQALRRVPWLPNPDALYRLICGEIFDPEAGRYTPPPPPPPRRSSTARSTSPSSPRTQPRADPRGDPRAGPRVDPRADPRAEPRVRPRDSVTQEVESWRPQQDRGDD